MLTIHLFGSPEILRDGQPLHLPRRKSRALILYLAAHPRPVTRERLLSIFWPDHERPAAQQTLRTSLHGLRKALGDALLAEAEALALAPDVQVDARAFEAGLPSSGPDLQALTRTLALYRGDFLADFSLPDAAAFEDWAAVERERYRRLAVRGLTTLSQLNEARRDYAAALAALDQALTFDPLQEDVQRTALRLHYLAGDRTGAVRRYEALRHLLNEEMGVPPMAETRAVYDAIITDRFEPPTSDAPSRSQTPPAVHAGLRVADPTPLFIGRDSELQTLRSIPPGRTLALIEGEAGIGKSRLVEEYLRASAALPLVGMARELEQALPYQPIAEALRGLLARADWPGRRAGLREHVPAVWLAEAARLLPELGLTPAPLETPSRSIETAGRSIDTGADESRLWEGLHQCLAYLAGRQPLALFLDDAQWADASTLALLGYLLRRAEAGPHPIQFIAAARPYSPRSPLATLLQTLTREGRLRRVPLSRLPAEAVTVLAQRLSPDYAQPLAYWLQQNSEGNPYILSELVRDLREHAILRADGVLNLAALSASPAVPQTVYSLIEARLARLSDAARRVLDAAVAAGREFEFDIVARAAGLSDNAGLDALDELRGAHLIAPDRDDAAGRRYAFDHTLTMEVAYRDVGELRHRLMHRRVAEAYEALYRDRIDSLAGVLAWHFIEGNAPERASPYAFRAGQQAARLVAWREAAALFEQALNGARDEHRVAILMELGEARFHAGRAAQASDAYREAVQLARARGDAALATTAQMALGRSLIIQARYAEAITLAQQICANRQPASAADAELLWGTALSLEGSDLAGAAEHLQRAADLMQAQPDARWLPQVKFEQAGVAAQRGDLPRALGLYHDLLSSAPPWNVLAHNNLAHHLHLTGDPSAAPYAQQGLALAHELGLLTLLPFLRSTLGEIALAAQAVTDAETHFAEGLALAEQFGLPERIVGLTANLGLVAIARGETALAVHRLSTALAQADALGTRHLAAQIRLWLAPLLPTAEARARLAEARALAEEGGRQRLLDEAARLEHTLL